MSARSITVLPWPAGVENRHHSGLGRTRLELQAKRAQPLAEMLAGLVLAEAHLGVTVEMTAQLDHLIDHRLTLASGMSGDRRSWHRHQAVSTRCRADERPGRVRAPTSSSRLLSVSSAECTVECAASLLNRPASMRSRAVAGFDP